MKNLETALLLLAAAFVAGCASTPPIDMTEPARLLGQESGVRLNAQMFMPNVARHTPIPITYEIENLRATPIAVAEIVPETTYDAQEQTLTIAIGSEVPGNEFLPKLLVVEPGAKRSFTTKGTLDFGSIATASAPPRYMRLKLNFLGQVAPFSMLVDIPEKAIHDPKLANELFAKWVEANETLVTNTVPVHYSSPDSYNDPASTRRPLRTVAPGRP